MILSNTGKINSNLFLNEDLWLVYYCYEERYSLRIDALWNIGKNNLFECTVIIYLLLLSRKGREEVFQWKFMFLLECVMLTLTKSKKRCSDRKKKKCINESLCWVYYL